MTPTCYIKRHAAIMPATTAGTARYAVAAEPDYKAAIPHPAMRRRMSRIIKMGVAAANTCLEGGIRPEAVITATGLGCIADTEKFADEICRYGEESLNPTAFIQSTFNTIGAQIALLHKIEAYNMTYVHRFLSFESALLDTSLLLAEGRHDILVGAIDEIYDTPFAIERYMGLLHGITLGEGAHFFLLDSSPGEAMAALYTCTTGGKDETPGSFVTRVLQDAGCSRETFDLWLTGENGNNIHDRHFAPIDALLPGTSRHVRYKETCGESPTASAAALTVALREIEAGTARNVLIYNHAQQFHSIILCGCL